MKTQIALIAVALLAGVSARAGLDTFEPEQPVIPDGNLAGITFRETLSDYDAGATVSALAVGLNISGGYDGNLFASLTAPNGTEVTLLTPSGNSGSGMHITLQDGGTPITAISDLSSGTYAASGALANINGSAANGLWTLFIADTVTGGGTSTLNSWSLNITAVPEPVNVALGILGALAVGTVVVRRCFSPRKPESR